MGPPAVRDYGFIPRTLCGDGDPLDILLLTAHGPEDRAQSYNTLPYDPVSLDAIPGNNPA